MPPTAVPRVAPDLPARQEIDEVADSLVTLMRAFGRARARLLSAAEHDVDWSAHVLLKCVANEGPIRARALAECLRSDPSTVSRQVAALVKGGLLERRADPEDGRACLLVTTERAAAVLADHEAVRLQHFARLLAGWSERDLRRFAGLLRQFTQDFENANHGSADRVPSRSHRPGGTA
jgi:DNA-binding MarR family transcriptional regulator